MINSRLIAVKALCDVNKQMAYSNIALAKILSDNIVSKEDKAFASALFYGVLDRKISIDYILSKHIKTPLRKVAPISLESLRIAIYQIAYMDRIPNSAAVNESVNIVKKSKERYNTSFVNGVLRNILRNGTELPKDNSISSLSIRFSCPEWIVKSFIYDYGTETTEKLLEASLDKPPLTLRINTLKTDVEALSGYFKKMGLSVCVPDIKDSLIINDGFDIASDELYLKGHYHIQDGASQISMSILAPKCGESVLDICAAPGGKTFTMAELMQNKGKITSLDLYEKRVNLIRSGADRLGISIVDAKTADACVFDSNLQFFDVVLCDVPCSGLGVIRRKPEIKYKDVEDFSKLEDIQLQILQNGSSYLKPGGRLMYSTCTLRKAENQDIVKAFLDKNIGYELKYQRTFMPHIDGTDGFYCALLEKSR